MAVTVAVAVAVLLLLLLLLLVVVVVVVAAVVVVVVVVVVVGAPAPYQPCWLIFSLPELWEGGRGRGGYLRINRPQPVPSTAPTKQDHW